MKMDSQSMLLIAGLLSALSFNLGVVFQTLPLPFRSLTRLGPLLMRDSIFSLVAIASVNLTQALVAMIQGTLQSGLDLNIASSNSGIIIAELVALNGLLFALIAGLNATIVLAPIAGAVSNMLSPVMQAVATSTILWIILQLIIDHLPSLWYYFFVLGISLVSVPLRFTRSVGLTMMSGAVSFAILLPLAPAFAMQIQANLFSDAAQEVKSIQDEILSDPSKAFDVLSIGSRITNAGAYVAGSVVLSLIIFPIAWLVMIGIISKSIAELLGGSSVFDVSSFVIGPSKQVGANFK